MGILDDLQDKAINVSVEYCHLVECLDELRERLAQEDALNRSKKDQEDLVGKKRI